MAVPGSGEIKLSQIAKEKVYDDYNAPVPAIKVSLKDVTVGGQANGSGADFDDTNQQSPSFPDNVAGYGMGEFYAYDHDFQAIPCNKAMDVVFLLDYTSSMTGQYNDTTNGLKAQVSAISNKVVSESGGDYRLAAVLIDQNSTTPTYWTGNNTTVSNLPSANKYNSGTVWLSAIVPFASANKTDFNTKIGYIAAGSPGSGNNSATSMEIGSGGGGPEPNDTAIDRVLNNSLAGSFRSGVTRMIILITDNSPDGDGDDQFNGAEELAKMGTLSNQAVANVCTISVLGNFSNSTSSDGTTTRYDIYNGYANNTGGLTNFAGDPSDIVQFIEDICDDIETGFPTFSNLSNTSLDTTPSGIVYTPSNITETSFSASMSVTDLNNETTHWWKPFAVNSVGTSYGEVKKVDASKWTANATVASSTTVTSRGIVYHTSNIDLVANGTVVTHPVAGTGGFGIAASNISAQGADNLGWVYCNSGFSQTPIANYSNNVVVGATGTQVATYTGTVSTGTKTQTITESSVPLLSGNSYRLRGWFEKKNNGGIQYSGNIVTFTVGSSFDFTASITVGTATYYTATARGWSTQFPFSMGSISNISFNSSTLSAIYWQNNSSGTDYIYIYFSGTRKSFSSFYIGLTSLGGSSSWTAIGSNIWRKAYAFDPMPSNGSSVTISADY
jgi:hypothetical protein